MASQDRRRESTGRRLTKKRKEPRKETREASFDVPERFQDGDDAHEDVTAPKRSNTISMNQSIFSMIARAGQHSQTDLGTMLEADSADSDDESNRKPSYHNRDGARLSRLSSTTEFPTPVDLQDREKGKDKHRRTLSENKLLRSLPKLTLSSRKEAAREDHRQSRTSASQILSPSPSQTPAPSTDVQSAKRKEDKSTEKELRAGKPKQSTRRSRTDSSGGLEKSKSPVTLARRLQQIFEFNEVEEVISEYPCWLLQSILLQGYMYITQRHVCFYAYIPKKHVSGPRDRGFSELYS
jgi:sterol 3beta-glucosyltransferase